MSMNFLTDALRRVPEYRALENLSLIHISEPTRH